MLCNAFPFFSIALPLPTFADNFPMMKPEPDTPQNSAREEAQRLGCDMSLIEANLELSYTERCIQHDRAISSAMALHEAALRQIPGLSDAIQAVSRINSEEQDKNFIHR
jgi:hypothetical protein